MTLRSLRMSEAQFTTRVVDAAMLYRWRVSHFLPSRNPRGGWHTALQGHRGFPDLALARSGVVLLAELKVGYRKPDADQVAWGEAIGSNYRLWYPTDWDTIVAELQ